MPTIDDIRRKNLATLITEAGGNKAFAERLGVAESQLSQWANGSANSATGKPRGMRVETAQRLERAGGKPQGWLDQQHGNDAAEETEHTQADVQHPTLTQALPVVLDALASLTPGRWGMVMSGLQPLAGHPEMRDDVIADVLPLLTAATPGKRTGT
jgi:DNA-binding transcriptional regulator YdaS (Cro superfamily)